MPATLLAIAAHAKPTIALQPQKRGRVAVSAPGASSRRVAFVESGINCSGEGMVSRAKILVVDDEPDILEIVQMNLEGGGYEVFGAATGAEALRQLKLVRPDLVILDVLLPELDGFEVLRRIRREPQNARTPVVMLTCMAEGTDVLRGLSDGAVEYLTKPFDPEHLVATVDALLDVFDPAMREERRAWLLSCQERKLAQSAPPAVVVAPVYTRSNVEAPLFGEASADGTAAERVA